MLLSASQARKFQLDYWIGDLPVLVAVDWIRGVEVAPPVHRSRDHRAACPRLRKNTSAPRRHAHLASRPLDDVPAEGFGFAGGLPSLLRTRRELLRGARSWAYAKTTVL